MPGLVQTHDADHRGYNISGYIWVTSHVTHQACRLVSSALSLIIGHNSDYGLLPEGVFNLLIAGQAARHSGF